MLLQRKSPCKRKRKRKQPQLQVAESQKKPKKRPVFPPVAPENLPPSYFVSATYDGRQRKAVIKLYEPTSGRIYFWYDNTGHKPYCLTNLTPSELQKIPRLMQHEGFDHFETEEKFDPLTLQKHHSHENRHERPVSNRRQTARHHPRHHPRRLPEKPKRHGKR